MVAAFEFFGCIPPEVWWDNPKTVATLILLGRQRQLHPRYAALASHYAFNPLFCMPARGNEKPDAESTVKAVQRRFATPVPRAADLDDSIRLFASAVRPSVSESSSRSSDHSDRRSLRRRTSCGTACSRHVLRCLCDSPAAPVDKYQTVAFDCNRYSVPRPFAFQMVTVKGYIDRVVIVAAGQAIATARAVPSRGTMILDRSTIWRPWAASREHSTTRRCSGLEASRLLRRDPCRTGSTPRRRGWRTAIRRVLQLLAEHPLDRVRRAVEACSSISY